MVLLGWSDLAAVDDSREDEKEPKLLCPDWLTNPTARFELSGFMLTRLVLARFCRNRLLLSVVLILAAGVVLEPLGVVGLEDELSCATLLVELTVELDELLVT